MKNHPHVLMYMQFYYSSELHRGIAQYAQEAGWFLNTSMYRSGYLPSRKWDGVIGSFDEMDDFYEQVIKPGRIPAVSLTETHLLPCVLPNNHAIGAAGAAHLIELGYKNFAYYFWQSKRHETTRSQALKESLNPKIHTFFAVNHSEKPRVRQQSISARMRELKRQLIRMPKPVAIMAPIDDLAVEIVEACLELGLKIPHEVGVLGVNDDRLICDFTAVPISSIDANEYKIGYEGAALLDQIMKGASAPIKPVLIQPKSINIRKSTDLLDIAVVPDRQVAIAVRYISENYTNAIQTDDVVCEAGASKSSLQNRFLRHMGHTIHDHILRKRIEHAKKLLREFETKTAAIAHEAGFGSRERFSKAFKLATGMNPAEYRDRESGA
jgi:LacI family transcriptional regulator